MTDTPGSQSSKTQAAIVSRHLPAGYSAQFDADASSAVVEDPAEVENGSQQPGQESSLKLQGGDIHRDLFRLRERPQDASLQRSKTFGHYSTLNDNREAPEDGAAADYQTAGAFRRQFVQRKASRFSTTNLPVTRDLIEFLDLYGSFAGEELGESDDEDANVDEPDNDSSRPSETRPLLGTRKSTRRGAKAGDAGTTKTFFTLLKAFIGTGIMFLPKAFNNGGILFSSIVLLSVAAISMLAFHLLLQCRTKYGGGYGDLGKAIAGPRARSLILASITLSQLGFVCAGIVFVAQNLYSFSVAVAQTDSSPIPIRALIAIQAIVLIPLAFIRNISKLGPAALLADAFILIGLTYIYQFDISTIARSGIAPSVRLFNPDSFTLTIGSAIFTFEGIGLILPIQSSMKKPERFEYLLGIVMFLATSIFASVGVLCYATFGEDTKIEIISNYPQTDKLVNAVQFLYSIAVLVGNPVQLFPAIRILEGAIFGHLSGKKDTRTKWIKNAFRSGLVLLCVGISVAGASDLDRFVALIGSFACVPLVYIYPPFLHYKGVATSKLAKAGDIAFVVLGLVAMAYTTVVTVANSFS